MPATGAASRSRRSIPRSATADGRGAATPHSTSRDLRDWCGATGLARGGRPSARPHAPPWACARRTSTASNGSGPLSRCCAARVKSATSARSGRVGPDSSSTVFQVVPSPRGEDRVGPGQADISSNHLSSVNATASRGSSASRRPLLTRTSQAGESTIESGSTRRPRGERSTARARSRSSGKTARIGPSSTARRQAGAAPLSGGIASAQADEPVSPGCSRRRPRAPSPERIQPRGVSPPVPSRWLVRPASLRSVTRSGGVPTDDGSSTVTSPAIGTVRSCVQDPQGNSRRSEIGPGSRWRPVPARPAQVTCHRPRAKADRVRARRGLRSHDLLLGQQPGQRGGAAGREPDPKRSCRRPVLRRRAPARPRRFPGQDRPNRLRPIGHDARTFGLKVGCNHKVWTIFVPVDLDPGRDVVAAARHREPKTRARAA